MSEEQKEESVVQTTVTTIAEEEAKSGEKIMPEMDEQTFVVHANRAHAILLKRAESIMKGMKAKHIKQAVIGAMDIRQADIPTAWIKKTGPKTATVVPEHQDTVGLWETLNRLQEASLIITNYQAKQKMIEMAQKDASAAKVLEESTDKVSNNQQPEGE